MVRFEIPYRRVLAIFLVLFLGISADLVYIQATPEANTLTALAYNPRHCVVDSVPQRGTIYDRNGTVLAYSKKDPNSPCGWLRVYTDPSLAPLLGYYDPQGFGVTGLEAAYDDVLSGYSSQSVAPGIRNGLQHLIDQLEHVTTYGSDVYLTIDDRIQKEADMLYGQNVYQGRPENPEQPGSILVEDPHTGEMLAYISHPSFDPNKLVNHNDAGDGSGLTVGQEYWNALLQDPNKPLIDRPVSDALPPGSAFKTMTLIAALDSNPQTYSTFAFDQADSLDYNVNGFDISSNNLNDYHSIPSSKKFPMDLVHQYAFSNNVAYARLAVLIGKDTYLRYASSLGMSYGSHLNNIPFDVPVVHSWVYQPQYQDEWDRDNVALAVTGFGQGRLLVSPLQDAVMTSAVAADGAYYQPHMLLKTVPHGVQSSTVANATPHLIGNVMSPAAAQQVRMAMRAVVCYGSVGASGPNFAPPANSPVQEGGKTGTAQTGIDNTLPHATYLSLAPDDTSNPTGDPPKLVIIIHKEFEGEAAYQAPIAQQLYQFALPLVDPKFPGDTNPSPSCLSGS